MDGLSEFDAVSGWSGDAAQVLATLMLALVLGQSGFVSHASGRGRIARWSAIGLCYWLFLALAVAADRAAEGEALSTLGGAFVDGAILAAGAFVLFSAIPSLWEPEEPEDSG